MQFEAKIMLGIDQEKVGSLRYTNRGRNVLTDADQLFAAEQIVRGRWHRLVTICKMLSRLNCVYYVHYDLDPDNPVAYISAHSRP